MDFKGLVDTMLMDMDEKSTTTITNKIKLYVNRGYRELAKREGLQKRITLETSNNKAVKPADCIKIDEVISGDYPIVFDLIGDSEGTGSTDGEVEIIYTYMPSAMSADTDMPQTNIANEEFIINYAKWLYYLSDGMEDMAALFRTEFEKMHLIKTIRVSRILDVYSIGGDSSVD